MVRVMEDQNEAWRRMTDARLLNLEAAVRPPRVRLARSGRPMQPLPYEPGDRKPLPQWLEVRQLGLELLLRLILDADQQRADELDVISLEDAIERPLVELEKWALRQLEPDIGRRETAAMILLARVILGESHTWPLLEIEELEEG